MSDKPRVQTLHANAAERAATSNWDANLAALKTVQPEIAALLERPRRTWALARDGSLSCRDDAGWFAGCSVPADAAAVQFEKHTHGKPFVGLPDPLTGHHVAAALRTLRPGEALLAHFPDADSAAVALCMADLADAITDEQLWLAVGNTWTEQLDALCARHPGLPVLGEFIRQPHHDDRFYEDVVAEVTPVVRAIAERTGGLVEQRRAEATATDTFAVIAGTAWRDGDDAGRALADAIDGVHVDPDRPTQASQAAVRLATPGAAAVIAANLFRTDIPDAATAEQPWITWHTRGPIRPRTAPTDKLLLADPDDLPTAQAAGWTEARIAHWPTLDHLPPTNGQRITLLTDIRSPDELPDEVEKFSGQRPLWEAAAQVLDADPFATRGEPADFVDQLAARLGITHFARDLLLEMWVMPRVLSGLLQTLRGAGQTVRAVRPETRAEWHAEVAAAAIVIDPSPTPRRGQLHATGRHVLTCHHRTPSDLLTTVRTLLSTTPPTPPEPVLSNALVRQALGSR